jgi:hypothetical protein
LANQGPKPLACTPQPRSNRPERHVEQSRNLRRREVIELGEHEHGTRIDIQGQDEGIQYFSGPLLICELLG